MRQLKKIVILSWLCSLNDMQGMEKKLLINDEQPGYSSLINPYDGPSNAYHKYGKAEISFVACIAKLPQDLQLNILSKLFSTTCGQDEKNRVKLSSLNPGLVLTLFCEAQKKCPLIIGNKEFGWQDLIVLTREQQEELFKLGNPNQCWAFLTGFDNITFFRMAVKGQCEEDREAIFKKQPDHIKKNLIIKRSCCCDKASCVVCMAVGGAGVGIASIAICAPYSQVPIFAGIGGGLMSIPSMCALATRISLCYECGVRKYSVVQGKYL